MTAADKWNFNDPNEHVTFARSCARTTLDYYSKALDAAEHFGLSEKFVNIPVAFLFPGGIENLENLANGKINGMEFLGKVGVDLAWSAATKPVQFVSQLKKVDIKTATKFFRSAKETRGATKPESGASSRAGTNSYGTGKHWESLQPVNTPKTNQQIGHINKQAFGGGEMKTDGEYVYRFDRAHKDQKVHLEMYKKVGNNKWQPYAECDPETGAKLEGSIQKMEKRPVIEW